MSKLKVEFDQELDNLITSMAKKQNTSKAEIIRKAISTYSALTNAIKTDGDYISVISKETGKPSQNFKLP